MLGPMQLNPAPTPVLRMLPSGTRLAALATAVVIGTASGSCSDPELNQVLPPGTLVDVFTQVANSEIDVLWVIDNSGSMVEEQENLGRNFDRFLSFLVQAKTDYHIAITTTDVVKDQGRLLGTPAVINSDTQNPIDVFKRNIKVGVGGSAREAGLDAARRTFELAPPEFLRPKAFLFVIFVSDEEDNSEPGTPKFFYRYFESIKGKGNENMVSAGAIIGDSPGGCVSPAGRANAGTRYQEVVEKVGGRTGSICSDQFDVILRELGVDAVGLKRKFPLSRIPDLATLEITVKYACDAPAEVLEKACVSMPAACADGDAVRLCTPKPKVEGSPDGWEYEPSTKTIVFAGAAIPPKGATIEALYFEPGTQGP